MTAPAPFCGRVGYHFTLLYFGLSWAGPRVNSNLGHSTLRRVDPRVNSNRGIFSCNCRAQASVAAGHRRESTTEWFSFPIPNRVVSACACAMTLPVLMTKSVPHVAIPIPSAETVRTEKTSISAWLAMVIATMNRSLIIRPQSGWP